MDGFVPWLKAKIGGSVEELKKEVTMGSGGSVALRKKGEGWVGWAAVGGEGSEEGAGEGGKPVGKEGTE